MRYVAAPLPLTLGGGAEAALIFNCKGSGLRTHGNARTQQPESMQPDSIPPHSTHSDSKEPMQPDSIQPDSMQPEHVVTSRLAVCPCCHNDCCIQLLILPEVVRPTGYLVKVWLLKAINELFKLTPKKGGIHHVDHHIAQAALVSGCVVSFE